MLTLKHIEQALKIRNFDSFKAQMGMSPVGRESMMPKPDKPPRESAVLILIFPKSDGRLHLVLTKRTEQLRGHSGQVSFPGGSRDEDDTSYEHTALRETCEEIGVCDDVEITVMGRLSKMWIPPSNFDVYPIVASTKSQPDMMPSPAEVAQILYMPVDALLDNTTKRSTQMNFRETIFDVPYYDVQGHIVWGATAGMLSELELRLKMVLKL